MIAPRLRLIVLIALLLLPAAALAAWRSSWVPAAWGVTALMATAAVLDAVFARQRFAGLQVTAPAIVRMTVNHAASIRLIVSNGRSSALPVRVGLALPAALTSGQDDERLHLNRSRESHTLAWPCRALRRGRFLLSACHIELPSYLGLWSLRRRFAMHSEIRAYPDLTAGQKHLAGLYNRREWGLRCLRKLGKGREFEQLRDYMQGDSYEDVDWKATARRRYPITRVFQVEQSQEIYVVLDASRLSTRNADYVRDRRQLSRSDDDTAGAAIFESYIGAALVMALSAERAADRYGLLIFGSRPDCFIKAGRGRAHYNACREALYNRMPSSVSPDFDELFTFIGTHIRKRALLIFLTHLDDPLMSESFIGAMRTCARRHVVMVNMFRPAGAYPLFSSADIHNENGIYEHLAGHMIWQSISNTRRKLRQYGAGLTLLNKDTICSQLVGQYMEIKQQQVL
ncbi:MAG: DUF58 domain-containing protein [Desulfobacteraceae bacterium]|nr:MAG: DUF58 domain-containing protein [Desulfobacteraceae bacterium]